MCLQQSFLSQKHFRDEIAAGIRALTNAAQYAEREIRPLGRARRGEQLAQELSPPQRNVPSQGSRGLPAG